MKSILLLFGAMLVISIAGCASPKTTPAHFTVNTKHQRYCVYCFMPDTWCDWTRKTNWNYTIYELNEPYPDFR